MFRWITPAALLLTGAALAQPAQPPNAVYPQPTYGMTTIFSPYAFGTYNDATGLSVGTGNDGRGQVNGFHNPAEAASFPDRGVVTLYSGATAPPILSSDPTPTYTQFTIGLSTPLSATVLKVVQQALAQCARNSRPVCMMIDTGHTPKYTGAITAVAADGSSLTVAGWYAQGNTAAGQVPSNTAAAFINPITKVWGMNGIIALNPTSYAKEMTYLEGDIYNYQAAYAGVGAVSSIGVSMNCNANDCGYGYIGLNNWFAGFLSRGNVYAGYYVQNASADPNPTYGFLSAVASGKSHHPFAYKDAGGNFKWVVNDNGNTTLGDTATVNGLALQVGTAGSPAIIQTLGVDTNIDLRISLKGTGSVRSDADYLNTKPMSQLGRPFTYQPSDAPGKTNWSVSYTGATAIGDPTTLNGLTLTPANPGSTFVMQTQGPDTNIDLRLAPKGTGAVRNSGDLISIEPISQAGHPFMHQPADAPGKTNWSVASNGTTIMGDTTTLNGMAMSVANAGSPPLVQALGVDTNIDLRLVAKGTGAVRITGQLTTNSGTLETPTTVAGLGTCTTALKGKRWAVTDALAPTLNATLAGGGAITTSAFCNGANWINL